MEKIEIPSWCNYPDANIPLLGCWSLLSGKVKNNDFCVDCDCFRQVRDETTQKELDFETEIAMKEHFMKLGGMITGLKMHNVSGPISPVLQHLEEARFWLKKCIESHNNYLKKVYGV